MALFPAVTVVPEGVTASEKSAKKTDNETLAVCPALVPLTVKFNGFAEFAERPVTVSVLDPPAGIDDGLKLHRAPGPQDRLMLLRNVLGPAAEMAKVAVVEPMRTTLDRALEESVKTGFPVPANCSVAAFTAFDVTWTVPVTLPVDVGVKLTAMVHVWPTLSNAGAMAKLVPQVLVWAKLVPVVMLVIVTA